MADIDAWQDGYRALAEFGLSFDLLVWPAQLPQAAAIAAETAAVPVVLEHLGLPDPAGDPGLRTWLAGVAALAQLPHARVKLSAFSRCRRPRWHGTALFVRLAGMVTCRCRCGGIHSQQD